MKKKKKKKIMKYNTFLYMSFYKTIIDQICYFIKSSIVLSIVLSYNKNAAAFAKIFISGFNSLTIPSITIIFASNAEKLPSTDNPFFPSVSSIYFKIPPILIFDLGPAQSPLNSYTTSAMNFFFLFSSSYLSY